MASNATKENDCQAAYQDLLLFDLACLGPALAIILVLASLKQRTRLKLEYCNGRPGLLIPVNFLGGLSNRYTITATFGATASKCAVLFLSTISDNALFHLGGPSWVKIFQGVVGVLVYGIVFYPFFACLTTEYKLIGSLLGFLYGALRFSFELSTLIRCSRNDETGLYRFSSIPEIPAMICVTFIVSRFAVIVFLEVRRKWYKPSRESEGGQAAVTSKPLAGEADILHVKALLGQGPNINQEDTRAWYKKFQHFIYKKRPDFKFATQLISTVAVTLVLLFQFLTVFLIIFGVLKNVYRSQWGVIGDLIADLYGCLQGGYVVSALISIILLMHFLKCHRDHFFQLCRGQRSFAQNVFISPSDLVGNGLAFSGYQIAHAVWGFLLLGTFLGVFFWILELLVKYRKELDLIQGIANDILASLPGAGFAAFLSICQFLLVSVVFRDREFPNNSVSINNRRFYSIMSYFFFFFNIIVGLFTCLARILQGLMLGVVFISRIDRTSLMLGFQKWDKGFVAYLGFLHVLVAHRHPVMLVFCELLNTRHSDTKSDQPLELRASNTSERQDYSHEKEARVSPAYPRDVRNPRLSQKAVNRWLLAVTLLRNPSLLQYRRQWYCSPLAMSEADTASITVLVQ